MKKKYSKKIIHNNVVFVNIIMVFTLFLFTLKGYAQSIFINANDKEQFISLMGGDMERSGPNFLKSRNQKEIIDWVTKDIPFNAFRVRYDKLQEMTEGQKDFSTYDGDVTAMKMMKEVNPNIQFFATMKSDYHGYSQGDRNNLPTFIYDYAYVNGSATGTKTFNAEKYALFLADYLEFMKNSGVPITYLSTSKEWVQVLTVSRAKATIEALIIILQQRNIDMPLIVDSGTWSISQGINVVNNYVNNDVAQYVYGFSSHNLWSGENKTWQQFITAAQNAGKYAFADETGHAGGGFITSDVSIDYPLSIYTEKSEMYKGGLQGELIFEIWPRGYQEVQKNGFYGKPIFFNNGSKAVRMRSYYIMQKFAAEAVNKNYINSSITNMSDVSTMAFGDDNQIALWVINKSDTEYNNLLIDINNLGLKEGMIVETTYWDESSEIEGVKNTFEATNNNQFLANVKAKSLTCFVIKIDYKLNPFHRINANSWVGDNITSITVNEGDNIDFGPQSRINGSWTWDGPNGFTATSRDISISSVNSSMAGDYVATYTGSSGETSTLTMSVNVICNSTPATTPYYQIGSNSLTTGNNISIDVAEYLKLSPEPATEGTWTWKGPNNYSASTREIEFENFYADMEGSYVATYTSSGGCSTDIVYNVTAVCSSLPSINPYSRINTEAWTNKKSELYVASGDKVTFGPNSSGDGIWYWSGPNGYEALFTREIIIDNITSAQAGIYTVTRINNNGCESSYSFTVYVDGALSIQKNEFSKIIAYPNPVINKLTISSEDYSLYQIVTVFSYTGKKILENKISQSNSKLEIDFSNLNSGLYFVELKGKTNNKIFKIIKN
ncbi:T9SS type A sorting domain-containing protein [Polaribacter sp. Asnod6-C07]|uniref:T9SS type A sorting domain-containing protein n=1 Tax=Polaribacter sp. Asnod6-C07 TaxID=3160582 RepID=UPI003865F2DF